MQECSATKDCRRKCICVLRVQTCRDSVVVVFSIIVIFGRSIFIVIIIIIVIILVIVIVVVVQRWCSRLAIPGHFLHTGGILEANE